MSRNPAMHALFARIGGRRPDLSGKRRNVSSLAELAPSLLERLAGDGKGRLVPLWRNWQVVMGEDIAALALPLGSRNSVLLVGADDPMAMQELSYCIPDMIDRANAVAGEGFFDKVELHMLLGKRAIYPALLDADIPSALPPRPLPPRPKRLGGLLETLDDRHPVGRCYAAYVHMYATSKDS